jgi:PPE-repeat protein
MVFDFGARPPEINSALMYSGAGAGPMMAASSAFNNLSAELSSNAASYEAVISQLTSSEWQGPSSQAMAAAARPLIGWLATTSGQLREAAIQAAASAAAYEAAFAATIPPAVIAANRAQLANLVATNILDRNAAAIAANEATYGEFWAQDAAAMYGYAGSSAAAAKLSPLTPPAATTNPSGQGAQAAAVSNAVSGNAATSGLNGLLGNLQNALSSAASPTAGVAQSGGGALLSAVNNFFNVPVVQDVIYNVGVTVAWNVAMITATFPMLGHFLASTPFGVTVGDITPLGDGFGMGTTLVSSTAPAGGAVVASMGSASSVGEMSVPAAWSAAAPAAETGATLTGSGWTAAVDEGADMAQTPGVMPGMASATGRQGYGFGGPRYGVKPRVMPKQVLV